MLKYLRMEERQFSERRYNIHLECAKQLHTEQLLIRR